MFVFVDVIATKNGFEVKMDSIPPSRALIIFIFSSPSFAYCDTIHSHSATEPFSQRGYHDNNVYLYVSICMDESLKGLSERAPRN